MSESIFPKIPKNSFNAGGFIKIPTEFRFPIDLTKREYYAGLALQGELASQTPQSEWADPTILAKRAVNCADALIEQLNQSESVSE